MKYKIILSGRDINLIQTALRLRLEASEENKDLFWAKSWKQVLNRVNKNTKSGARKV